MTAGDASRMSNDPKLAANVGGKLASPFLDRLPIAGLAISVFDQDKNPSLIHATDTVSAQLEQMQFDLGEGPSFDAISSAAMVSVPYFAQTNRWPAFIRGAEELDVGAIFVFPLMLGTACMGSVMCYRTSPGDFDDYAADIGMSLSSAVAGPAFRLAIDVAENETPDDESPVESRSEVHQATGMILWQLNISATDAFARLRAHAFSSGRPVQEIAHSVVCRELNFAQLSD